MASYPSFPSCFSSFSYFSSSWLSCCYCQNWTWTQTKASLALFLYDIWGCELAMVCWCFAFAFIKVTVSQGSQTQHHLHNLKPPHSIIGWPSPMFLYTFFSCKLTSMNLNNQTISFKWLLRSSSPPSAVVLSTALAKEDREATLAAPGALAVPANPPIVPGPGATMCWLPGICCCQKPGCWNPGIWGILGMLPTQPNKVKPTTLSPIHYFNFNGNHHHLM